MIRCHVLVKVKTSKTLYERMHEVCVYHTRFPAYYSVLYTKLYIKKISGGIIPPRDHV